MNAKKAISIDFRRLKELRGNRTMVAVAEAIGITRQHLWQIESGKRSPGAKILTQLCWLYDIEFSDLSKSFSNGHSTKK
jgi:transcriptional regulator with XRE-family HTH domain